MNSDAMEPNAEDRFLAIKIVMMPADTNPHGTIFGGVILSYIDLAGSVAAQHEIRRAGWPRQQIVLVGMDRVAFHRPVHVGDIVSFWATLKRVGRTSMTIHVTVEADRKGDLIHVTEAEVTYVSVELVDGARRPVPIRGAEHAGKATEENITEKETVPFLLKQKSGQSPQQQQQ
jgi:acyl-CoA thioesterase YciA